MVNDSMANVSIYTLTSQLHDEQTVAASTREFLNSLDINHDLYQEDFSTYGQAPLSLIYVRTGGTEGIFKTLLPQIGQTRQPILLLTSGTSNSLAASMEILSYLQQHHLHGEILHGTPQYIHQRISELERVAVARRKLHGTRLGIIGKPSDWLISSEADYDVVRHKLGIELVDISLDEVLKALGTTQIDKGKEGAMCIYEALKKVVTDHQLQGFTLRCFDLLSVLRNTGCLALAKLNAEGLVAGCEGDVPAMLSMMVVRSLFGISGFQANPAHINSETGEMLLAHCTIPLDMVSRYELDTHFESGIGVGIRGYMPEGPVTLFKLAGDLSRHFIAEGQLLRCEARPNLCRTQTVVQLSNPSMAQYFLTHPIGNHHILMPGHCQTLLEEMVNGEW